MEPVAEGEVDDLHSDEWFRGSDEAPPVDHPPVTTVDPATSNRIVEARLTGRHAVGRALEHLLWAWQSGAVISFSIESSSTKGTRISIVYEPA